MKCIIIGGSWDKTYLETDLFSNNQTQIILQKKVDETDVPTLLSKSTPTSPPHEVYCLFQFYLPEGVILLGVILDKTPSWAMERILTSYCESSN